MRPELVPRPTESLKVTLSDGVERTLRYSVWALRLAKQEFGGSITNMETLKKIDEDNIGKLFWYGLAGDDPENPAITVEQVEKLIDPGMIPYLMAKYVQAISMSIPDPKNVQSGQAKTPETKKSTGSQSGQSDDLTSRSGRKSSGASRFGSSMRSVPGSVQNGAVKNTR